MLSEREKQRYARQVIMFGEEGQERLRSGKVFIAGAGGLGCPVALYLAVAGVGHITIVDDDSVELSNLNRQILHWEEDIGRKKADSALGKLRCINRETDLVALDTTISGENAASLAGDADIIVDAMDNYPARYVLNHVAVERKIPFIHGAIRGFDGQATAVVPGKSACLRCIFPAPPPKEVFPVVGVTAGIIGLIQANEVIKYLTGVGELLENRLLIWNGLSTGIEIVLLERDPLCRECGGHSHVR